MNCNLSLVDPNYNGAKLKVLRCTKHFTWKTDAFLGKVLISRTSSHTVRHPIPGNNGHQTKKCLGQLFRISGVCGRQHSAKSKKHKFRSKADRGSSPALLFHNSVTLGKSQHLQSFSLARKRRIIIAHWSAGIFNKITEVKCQHILNSQQALAITIRLISLCGPLSC